MHLEEIISKKLQNVDEPEKSSEKINELEEFIAGCGCGSNSASGTCGGACGTSRETFGA